MPKLVLDVVTEHFFGQSGKSPFYTVGSCDLNAQDATNCINDSPPTFVFEVQLAVPPHMSWR